MPDKCLYNQILKLITFGYRIDYQVIDSRHCGGYNRLMILEHDNYRVYLRSVLAERKRSNPAYSMRAFAKNLGLGQSAISQVLAGKKNLSLECAERLSSKLQMQKDEAEYFRLLVQIESTKDLDLKKALLERAQELNPKREVRELSVDYFTAISDWYHLAVKNILSIEMPQTAQEIAKRLGISKIEVESAIERLLRLEMIEPDHAATEKFRKVKDYTITRSLIPNEALRRFHRQMLDKAKDALSTQTPQEKFVGSETLAIAKSQLPKAFAITEEYLKKISALSESTESPTDVYHAGVQFFNLTNGRVEK